MDAGFQQGQVCQGICDAGTDLTMCGASLEYQCGTSAINKKMLLDDCGGHASPYHYHADLKCEYANPTDTNTNGGHSPVIGFGLDGRGLYGRWEVPAESPAYRHQM